VEQTGQNRLAALLAICSHDAFILGVCVFFFMDTVFPFVFYSGPCGIDLFTTFLIGKREAWNGMEAAGLR
jgi:hypothetical protein